MKITAVLAAGTLTFGAFGIAHAASLQITNGIAATIPASGPSDVPLPTPFGQGDIQGYTNATIELVGDGAILVEYFGKEASWTNSFSLDGNTITTTENGGSAQPLSSFTTGSLSSGIVPFKFAANGTEFANGSANAVVQYVPNFFASSVLQPTQTSDVSSVWLLLDDGGGLNDDNDYNDMVVRLSVQAVPLPASGLLLVTGFIGIAARRLLRSTRASAGMMATA